MQAFIDQNFVEININKFKSQKSYDNIHKIHFP